MISEIVLHNYKSFIDQKIKTAPLTVLTGLNSTGKSSIIKAIKIIKVAYSQGVSVRNFDKIYNVFALKSKLVKGDSFFHILKV
ncbi:AAA family ATPase [Treponema pedis]|uniref:AAA family ATPase n=1 Tax=Treponema pedis TaxID=409322 RepID=A0A7S7AWV3_9SPIR|nr:AAA family ATPase [Treponema pedis]QOW61700.1 AAA family ATPase [Treponema pedis]